MYMGSIYTFEIDESIFFCLWKFESNKTVKISTNNTNLKYMILVAHQITSILYFWHVHDYQFPIGMRS